MVTKLCKVNFSLILFRFCFQCRHVTFKGSTKTEKVLGHLSAVSHLCLLSSTPISKSTLEITVQRSPSVNQASFLTSTWTMLKVSKNGATVHHSSHRCPSTLVFHRKGGLSKEEKEWYLSVNSQLLPHLPPYLRFSLLTMSRRVERSLKTFLMTTKKWFFWHLPVSVIVTCHRLLEQRSQRGEQKGKTRNVYQV